MSAIQAAAVAAQRPTYEFEGREVTLPVFARKARSASVTYPVPRDVAQSLIPGDRLEVAEVMPGRTLFSITSVDYIDIDHVDGQCRTRLSCDGRHVLTLSVPDGGTRKIPDSEMTTYSFIDGALHRTRFLSGAEDCAFHLGGSDLELGDHPIAAELRSMGLPRRPLLSVWMGTLYGRFDAPEPV